MRVRVMAGLTAAAASAAGVVSWMLWEERGLLVVGFGTLVGCLTAVLAMGTGVRRAARRADRDAATRHDTTVERLASLSRDVASTSTTATAALQRIDVVEDRLASLEEALSQSLVGPDRWQQSQERLQQSLDRLLQSQDRAEQSLAREAARADRARRDQFHQIEALIGLYRELEAAAPIVGTRGWAASPDVLHHLFTLITLRHPSLVVECGSGMSTVVMGYAARAAGQGHIVALEHDPVYADKTAALLAQHGVADWAEVRLAPLETVQVDGEQKPWYPLTAVPDGPIGLLFVDGPPGDTSEMARLPALPLLQDRLAADAVVVLDDYHRPDERRIVDRWIGSGEWSVEFIDHEKGTAVLTRTEAE